MNNFKKNNGGFGGRREFNKPNFSGGFGGRAADMHQAICADCGRTCEVPFKPNGMKPVYCKDCFAKNGGQVDAKPFPSRDRDNRDRDNRDNRGDRNDRPRERAPYQSATPVQSKPQGNDDKKFDDLKRQLETMNAKFDRLIDMADSFMSKSGGKTEIKTLVVASKPVAKAPVVKTSVKKAAPKKVAPKKKK